ncbi:MAG: CooT family nickel-binding protein [Clostridiales bacterium]|nr:CooT family nickel-binding protein [Candidatus Crickella equi]
MCLSNVYKGEVKDENLLARNIADIRVEGGKIILTDLMGIRKEIEATIKKVDLMDNYIVLD